MWYVILFSKPDSSGTRVKQRVNGSIMATPIVIANTVVTVLLTLMVLNHFQIVEYDPIDMAVNEFQRRVYYSQIDGSVMAPPETFMTVVNLQTVTIHYP